MEAEDRMRAEDLVNGTEDQVEQRNKEWYNVPYQKLE